MRNTTILKLHNITAPTYFYDINYKPQPDIRERVTTSRRRNTNLLFIHTHVYIKKKGLALSIRHI